MPIYHADLETKVDGLAYDFNSQIARLYVPRNAGADMEAAIALFTAIERTREGDLDFRSARMEHGLSPRPWSLGSTAETSAMNVSLVPIATCETINMLGGGILFPQTIKRRAAGAQRALKLIPDEKLGTVE